MIRDFKGGVISDSKPSVCFPGESESCRVARDQLLEVEIGLRRKIEDVAAKRRELPLGGRIEQDYVFEQTSGSPTQQVRLSELFSEGKDTDNLQLHVWPEDEGAMRVLHFDPRCNGR